MEKNNNIKIMGVFATVLLLVIVITASFAYFGSFNVNLNNNVAVNVNSVSPGDATFTSNATQLNLQVPAANMSQTVADNTVAAASNTATLTVSLTSGNNDIETTCTFDIYYEYTGSNYYGVSPTIKTTGADKEITMTVNAPSGTSNFAIETNFDYNTSNGWTTENNKRKVKLVENASISNHGTIATTQEYTFTGKYYNINSSQEQLANKSFIGIIYAIKKECKSSSSVNTLSKIITEKSQLISSQDGSVYGIVAENGLRYEGTDPDNYICLDNSSKTCSEDNLYRIIGIFNEYVGSSDESSKLTEVVKIIKSTSYGSYAWDDNSVTKIKSSLNNYNVSLMKTKKKYKVELLAPGLGEYNGENDWIDSTLLNILENNFYNSLPNTVTSKILNVKWHLGGPGNYNYDGYYWEKITANDMFSAEREPYTTSGTLCNLNDGYSSFIYSKIGLMYPSDYGYGVLSSECDRDTTLNSYSTNCYLYDWLNTNDEWTISPLTGCGSSNGIGKVSMYSISIKGNRLEGLHYSSNYLNVRPTFYISSDISVIGSGSRNNPYFLSE